MVIESAANHRVWEYAHLSLGNLRAAGTIQRARRTQRVRATVQACGEGLAKPNGATYPNGSNQDACHSGVGKGIPKSSERAPIALSVQSPRVGQREALLLHPQTFVADHRHEQPNFAASSMFSVDPVLLSRLPYCSPGLTRNRVLEDCSILVSSDQVKGEAAKTEHTWAAGHFLLNDFSGRDEHLYQDPQPVGVETRRNPRLLK